MVRRGACLLPTNNNNRMRTQRTDVAKNKFLGEIYWIDIGLLFGNNHFQADQLSPRNVGVFDQ